MKTKITQYEAEVLCQAAHRKLGIKAEKGTATKTDRLNVGRAARGLAKFFPLVS